MTAHAFSLASKLATLDVGEALWFSDDAPLIKPTNMERQVQNLISKSRRLVGRRFTTTRADAITVGRVHHHLLRVERIE
jgi:bifunctional N-acetylglucosamine-1-phosphate-uridyltransferase/glucosamine-1-phosphate-acetyltransferase GlmU-like protein